MVWQASQPLILFRVGRCGSRHISPVTPSSTTPLKQQRPNPGIPHKTTAERGANVPKRRLALNLELHQDIISTGDDMRITAAEYRTNQSVGWGGTHVEFSAGEAGAVDNGATASTHTAHHTLQGRQLHIRNNMDSDDPGVQERLAEGCGGCPRWLW